MNADGIYAASKFQRTRTPKIIRDYVERPKKYDRIPGDSRFYPGPGNYEMSKYSMNAESIKKITRLGLKSSLS